MTIGERIRLVRQQKDLSQTDLSEKSGVNLKSLSRYELGTSIPPANLLFDLAVSLGVTSDYLLSGKQVQIKDQALFEKFEIIQGMDTPTKTMIEHFLDLAIRDFKTKQAYSAQ